MPSKWALISALLAAVTLLCSAALVNSDAATASTSDAVKDEVMPPSGSDSSLSGSQVPETISEVGSLIPGVYKEYLPQPVLYESALPAVFQYQTPVWNKTEITFNNWYNCVTETVPYRYSCPVTFHMNKAIVNLHVDFEGLHPISDTKAQSLQESMRMYYDRLTSHSEFCDKIQKHFAGIWTESQDLERYLSGLQGCSRGSELHPYFDRSLQDYNYSIRSPFTKMENNFYNTFYKHILGSGGKNSSLDLVASALLSNTRTSLQGAILGQYYAERNRWTHANQDCRQGYIPTSIVTLQKFNESLSSILKMSYFHHDNDLSVPPAQMSKYFNLPLADCTHTTDAFVVRILIPVLKKFRGEILQLVHVHSIPFQYRDHICRIKLPEQKTADPEEPSSSESMYLYHELTHRAYRTNCKPNELCKISDYLLDSRRSDPCVSSLLSRNDTGIRAQCDFECLPQDEYVLPSVVRVASNKFVVTGNSLSLRIVCGRLEKKEKLVYIKPEHIGATLIKLPCHCRLIFPHFNVFYGGQCDTEEGAGHIVHGDEEEQHYLSHEAVGVTSVMPFMFGKLNAKSSPNSVNHQEHHDTGYFYDNLAEGQLINLTEILDTQRIENYIRSSEIRRQKEEGSFKGMDFYAEKLQSGEHLYENENGGGGVGGLFWFVFILSVIVVLSLQIYIIVMFKRYDKVTYPKDDRILYRVDPDPDTFDRM